MTGKTETRISYVAACVVAADSYQRKAEHNKEHSPNSKFLDTERPLWEAQAELSAALRALAQLLEDAAELSEQHATTHLPGHDEAWDMLADLRAGFTAAPPLPAGGVGTDETATA